MIKHLMTYDPLTPQPEPEGEEKTEENQLRPEYCNRTGRWVVWQRDSYYGCV